MTTLTLPDGRILDLHLSGADDGAVLLFHHGTPSSKVPPRAVARIAADQGIRIVSYSRPGYGGSTRHEGRRVVDVAADAAAILDHLGVERCVTAGWSGGGPHALACAARLPDRIAGALTIAGVGPSDAPDLDFLAGMGEQNIEEFGAAVAGPDVLRPYLEKDAAELAGADAAGIIAGMQTLLPPVDVAQLTDEFGADMAANLAEALRTGIDGWFDDDLAFVAPWGFDLAEITVPVFVWQGDLDLMVPIAHGRWLAEHIPGATAHLEDGEGHLSVGVGAMDRMLAELRAVL